MPRRLLHKRPLVVMSSGLVAFLSLGASAWFMRERTLDVNDLIYQQCVANEIQDAVIVAQLNAAKTRARGTLKPGPVLNYQLQVLNDGIDALEPPDEPDCQPPKGTEP